MVTVTPLRDGFPTALFAISKSSIYSEGHVFKITGVCGGYTPEQLDVIWPAGDVLQLRKNGPGYDGEYVVGISMKNASGVPNPPAIPTDVCDMAYVDRTIREQLDIRFGGKVVTLHETDNVKVMNLRCGSYVVTVTPLSMDGAPTASFAISKNSVSGLASVTRTSADSGRSRYAEQLELSWPENSMMLLRKTGPGYDGEYLVDMNLKNFSSVPEAPIPSDAATRAYVDAQIEERIQAKFSGKVVSLTGTEFHGVINLQPGSYVIAITNLVTGGPTATFSISKNSPNADASILRNSSVCGSQTGEALELVWPENKMLALRKTGSFHDGDYLVDFNLKNFSNVPEAPLPSDAATRAYVDAQIEERMQTKFSGKVVSLTGTEFHNVTNLQLGSYMIAITNLVTGGPTATFSISKNSPYADASILRNSSLCGLETGEALELVWPENKMLALRKTGSFHDGDYLVDFNLKNFSNVPEAPIPTDAATRAYVDAQIEERMQAKFSGKVVSLTGTEYNSITNLQPGSYVIAITNLVSGGPTATFSISKNSPYADASILRSSSLCGLETGEALELVWPENKMLALRKTGNSHDGDYLVDFNLKNLSNVPEAPIPTDAATRAYVDAQIEERMQAKFSGKVVSLMGTEFRNVTNLQLGSYMIAITNLVTGGPTATFSISKNSPSADASISRNSSLCGLETGEALELVWPENKMLALRKTGSFHDGDYLVDFNLKNFSNVPEAPLPSDAATRAYVDAQIEERMQTKFSGKVVSLTGTEFHNVTNLQLGSYMIAITNLVSGGPTATFSISKNSPYADASILRNSSLCGLETGEALELVWPENKMLALRKTGNSHDGDYLVDFNLKNISPTMEDPVLPVSQDPISGTAVRGPMKMILEGSSFSPGSLLGCSASYIITARPAIAGGPTATFAVSKSSDADNASIFRMTSCPAQDSGEQLELIWPENGRVMLRKSGPMHDGEYLLNFSG